MGESRSNHRLDSGRHNLPIPVQRALDVGRPALSGTHGALLGTDRSPGALAGRRTVPRDQDGFGGRKHTKTVTRPPLNALLLVDDARLARRVARCLDRLGIGHDTEQVEGVLPDWTILDLGAADRMDSLPAHPVLVCGGTHVVARAVVSVETKGGRLIVGEDFTPLALLSTLFGAGVARGSGFCDHLVAALGPTEYSTQVVDLLLANPNRNPTQKQIARALQIASRRLRVPLAELGFDRWEHLWTRLRCEAWIWLVGRRVPRSVAERLLGIVDRSNFRKSCRRAQCEPPWSEWAP